MSEHKRVTVNLLPALAANGARRLAAKLTTAEVTRCPTCGSGLTVYSFKGRRNFGRGEYAQLREAATSV